VFSRHRLLTRFFEEVLSMKPEAAGLQACAMEHSLTDEAMDGLVRFFEFLGACPSVIESFRQCPLAQDRKLPLSPVPRGCTVCATKKEASSMSLAELRPGQGALVSKIGATGALRQRLLDMGILPETQIDVERVGLGGDPFWVRCQGARLALRRSEASSIMIHSADGAAAKK
jgi:Fe2+ transport system protein FeoA